MNISGVSSTAQTAHAAATKAPAPAAAPVVPLRTPAVKAPDSDGDNDGSGGRINVKA